MSDDDLAFRLDCGATWLNLLATQGRLPTATPVERIATAERLARWLALHELTPVKPVTEDDVRLAQGLRKPIRAIAWAQVTHQYVPGAAMRELARFLREHDDPIRLLHGDDEESGEDGGRMLRAAPPTTAAALARVARQAVDHLTGPERLTLRTCPEQDCLGLFSDPTGRRRWCPSPACASRGRVRALRARRAADSVK
ncbi:CGNR zinc finger domain-containing protein [Streptacidiphilus anmyonensis]|uniref:CGNR zinc finger domain-containing protein n=1 Tax=Streptacidiphilus anmyonensis TaxID=405782 RepID=UPI0005A681CB|nr:ABATE domain-containing protein [Streptacidiphilus anmyonensis]